MRRYQVATGYLTQIAVQSVYDGIAIITGARNSEGEAVGEAFARELYLLLSRFAPFLFPINIHNPFGVDLIQPVAYAMITLQPQIVAAEAKELRISQEDVVFRILRPAMARYNMSGVTLLWGGEAMRVTDSDESSYQFGDAIIQYEQSISQDGRELFEHLPKYEITDEDDGRTLFQFYTVDKEREGISFNETTTEHNHDGHNHA